MTFDKDNWILKALKERVYVVDRNGGVYRRRQTAKGASHRPVTHCVHRPTGRVYFTMTYDGITKSVLINRIVALALIPNPNNLAEVNHKDGNKSNNHPDNLEWCSRSEQEKHAFATGLKSSRGSSNSNAKLNVSDVATIRTSTLSATELAKHFGVSPKTIRDVLENKTWRHV